jgi:elongator complex protein 4
LVFETLHLEIEGGVGERRTTPSAAAAVPAVDAPKKVRSLGGGSAAVEVKMIGAPDHTTSERAKTKLPKKVAFQADRPDLYDF